MEINTCVFLHCCVPRWLQIPDGEPAQAGQPAKERQLNTFLLREEVLDIMKPHREMLNPALFPVVSTRLKVLC